LSNFSSISI